MRWWRKATRKGRKTMESKMVDSKVYTLKELFADKFTVDFYQREYVWQRKQIEDLIMDLSTEFLKNWSNSDDLKKVSGYDPYYMGEIVLSLKNGERSSIIDGQQRITTLTLLLIFLVRTYGNIKGFPKDVEELIYADYFGERLFNLDIEERKECMLSLFEKGEYVVKDSDSVSVKNLVARYNDISECWNDKIFEDNIVNFVYWVKEKIVFSKVWTNSDEFAYVIFETMNDRGLSLTQVEMFRSYLLANIDENHREKAMQDFDEVIKKLVSIKLNSKSKAEFEFFKLYFRGHYAEDLSQSRNSNSDFTRIGKEFHRWVRENSKELGLNASSDFVDFLDRITYYAGVYETINNLMQSKNAKEYLYLIVNNDYGFTLQPALILASVNYQDSDEIVSKKIKVVSKYITKILSWRVWNHYMISQSSMESTIYELCKKVRGKTVNELEIFFNTEPVELPKLENAPTLNQQNRYKIKVLLALITEIVATASNESDYLLQKDDIEIEHIWANHYERHTNEFDNETEFSVARNGIGDLLLLPKSFNSSYGDALYSVKVEQYFSQNILAQTLNKKKYQNNPGFIKFKSESGLDFKPYDLFDRNAVNERAQLYKAILEWNWKK